MQVDTIQRGDINVTNPVTFGHIVKIDPRSDVTHTGINPNSPNKFRGSIVQHRLYAAGPLTELPEAKVPRLTVDQWPLLSGLTRRCRLRSRTVPLGGGHA